MEEECFVDLLKVLVSLMVCTLGILDLLKLGGKLFGKMGLVINNLAQIVLDDLSILELFIRFRC